MPSLAAFFGSMPTWAQALVGIILAIGAILVTWKGVLPLFIHHVPNRHMAVKYWRNQLVYKRSSGVHVPVSKAKGPLFVFPGLISYRNTDMRSQTKNTPGFKVDIGDPAVTYDVEGLDIIWEVANAALYQTVNAEPETTIVSLVRAASRSVWRQSTDLTTGDITERCKQLTPTLAEMGVELIRVLVVSGSFSTVNLRGELPSGAIVPRDQ